MKISCTQENLNQGLNIISRLIGKNVNLPILANVLIKIENKTMVLAATNLEIGVTAQIRSKIEKDGEFTTDAKLLTDYISLLPKERIDLEVEKNILKITCQKQKTKINGQSAEDFPLIPKIKKENPILISAKELKQGINEVVFAVSNNEIRPDISGVLMQFSGKKLILAATDGYRLAEKHLNLAEEVNFETKKVIAPVKTLQEISRIIGIFKEDLSLQNIETVEIYLQDNQIMFSYNGVDLISRLIEATYPDYQQIIPASFKTEVRVKTNDLIKMVKTASLFTKNSIYDICLEFKTDSQEIIITSSSSQTGENISQIEAEITGESNIMVLNYHYLLDGLQNIDSEKLILKIDNSNLPCLLKPENQDGYLYIIMPIRQ